MQYNQLFINGQWVDGHSGQWIDVENPWTKAIIDRVPRGNAADVDDAVRAARAAFPAWSALSIDERADRLQQANNIFRTFADELTEVEIAELGQPRAWTRKIHVERNLERIDNFVSLARRFEPVRRLEHGTVYREAIGVVGCLTPWNYPLGQAVQKIAPALLAGNCVIFKPSQHTPLSAYYFIESCRQAGIPAGVINLVTGRGSEVGDALCTHPDVQMISFTGSTVSGRDVGRQSLSTIKKIALELGGKSPLLCLPGTDYAAAAKEACRSCFSNSGQTCVAWTRFLVPASELDAAKTALQQEAAGWVAGDPNDEQVQLGPIVNAAQYAKVCDYIQGGVDAGATLLVGAIPDKNADKRLVQPVIFADTTADMRIIKEEIFGPVLSIQVYDDVEDGLAIANDTEYGLGASVFGPAEAAEAMAHRLLAGQVYVNSAPRDIEAPFGGYKQSGLGREGGLEGFEEYFEVKAIFV